MLEPIKIRYDKTGPKVVEALQKRHFEAYYISDSKDVAVKVLELIPAGSTVSWGGTTTVDQLGIKKLLADKGYTLIDRDTAKSPEEREEIMHKAENGSPELLRQLSDYYGSSAWKRDFAADEAGLLPKSLKRGVLSEDGIHDLLESFGV